MDSKACKLNWFRPFLATFLIASIIFVGSTSFAQVLGKYINDYGGGLVEEMTILEENGRYYIKVAYQDGSNGKQEYVATKTDRGIKLQEQTQNSYGDYYILNRQGNLEAWDSQGIIDTVSNVK